MDLFVAARKYPKTRILYSWGEIVTTTRVMAAAHLVDAGGAVCRTWYVNDTFLAPYLSAQTVLTDALRDIRDGGGDAMVGLRVCLGDPEHYQQVTSGELPYLKEDLVSLLAEFPGSAVVQVQGSKNPATATCDRLHQLFFSLPSTPQGAV